MNYIIHLVTTIGIYSLLGLGINVLLGGGGIISLCQASFYGLGAYTTAILTLRFGMNFFWAAIIGIIISAVLSLLISILSARLRGDILILGTLAFQVIFFRIFHDWHSLTNGPIGISGIGHPCIFNIEINPGIPYMLLVLACLGLVLFFLNRLNKSPFGRALRAMRDDEPAALSLGKPTLWIKIRAFIISAGISGLAGALYAGYATYIDPTLFGVSESIFILSIVLVGGAGKLRGALLGAALLITLPEFFSLIGFPDTLAPHLREILYGLFLIYLMYQRPQGLLGDYALK
ncbi:MAG: branched-chain amino acid ABC transporter permease [Candidatus Eremiobacteraeota bacterium]|nr:branched-chain amino acid ABC transporter permease [Candidatus Eremiobacteraeota bacterium]